MQHYSQTDDLWTRFKVPEWRVFCHTERLRDHPARLKLVLSDSAISRNIFSASSSEYRFRTILRNSLAQQIVAQF